MKRIYVVPIILYGSFIFSANCGITLPGCLEIVQETNVFLLRKYSLEESEPKISLLKFEIWVSTWQCTIPDIWGGEAFTETDLILGP